MDCFYCKGQTSQGTTKYMTDLGDCVVIIKNVPAYICSQCGETFFTGEILQQIERIVDSVKNSILTEVVIIDYSQSVG